MRTAVITIASGRHDHLRAQQAGLARSFRQADQYVVVAMDDAEIRSVVSLDPDVCVVDVPRLQGALPLAAARNAGAQAAIVGGAELLIFLDVDCIPGESLIARYVETAEQTLFAGGLLNGPVAYLPQGANAETPQWQSLARPHPARPLPPENTTLLSDDYNLFWSLSFAVTTPTWERIGGFGEEYRGYGGEDTDFAYRAQAAGVAMWWVGGAWAYHQHHESQSPPVDHLDDILRNATIFQRQWGQWPMQGWLTAFRELGLVMHDETTNTWITTQSSECEA
jgi:GT2 family glycosyltransferase